MSSHLGFLQSHDDYQGDSVVTDTMCRDLVAAMSDLGLGRVQCPELLGDVKLEPIHEDGA